MDNLGMTLIFFKPSIQLCCHFSGFPKFLNDSVLDSSVREVVGLHLCGSHSSEVENC